MSQNKRMRLDKYIADMTEYSRNDVKKLIRQKQVEVNDQIVNNSDVKVTDADCVKISGELLTYEQYIYYMLNKPAGVLSATKDGETATVIDYIDDIRKRELFPVGRLDKDTTGFILLTNNGDLAHNMLHPKKHVDKKYVATVDPPLDDEAITMFKNGIELDDFTCKPAILELDSTHTIAHITISEGKFHQIKRMVKACGSNVINLHRYQIGPLVLDINLKIGQARPLTSKEITMILEGI